MSEDVKTNVNNLRSDTISEGMAAEKVCFYQAVIS